MASARAGDDDDDELLRRIRALRPPDLPVDPPLDFDSGSRLGGDALTAPPPPPQPPAIDKQLPTRSGAAHGRSTGSRRDDERVARRKARREQVRQALEAELRPRQGSSSAVAAFVIVVAAACYWYFVYSRQ